MQKRYAKNKSLRLKKKITRRGGAGGAGAASSRRQQSRRQRVRRTAVHSGKQVPIALPFSRAFLSCRGSRHSLRICLCACPLFCFCHASIVCSGVRALADSAPSTATSAAAASSSSSSSAAAAAAVSMFDGNASGDGVHVHNCLNDGRDSIVMCAGGDDGDELFSDVGHSVLDITAEEEADAQAVSV